jgi:hypothetical protein
MLLLLPVIAVSGQLGLIGCDLCSQRTRPRKASKGFMASSYLA